MPDASASPLHLAPVEGKATLVAFEGGRLSSDAGLLLRNAPDDQLGFTRPLAAVRRDPRAPRRSDCTRHDLRKQRGWHSAAGDEDAHDATTLRHDPLCNVLRGRLPESGPPVAAPPTSSRGENRVSRTALSRRARGVVQQCLASYDRVPQRIVLDVAETEDPAHGEQEHLRYAGYEGGECCFPLHVSEGLSGRLSPTIFQAKRCSGAQRLAVLTRLVTPLRHAWPDTLSVFRGDRHVASPEVRPWLEAPAHRPYVTGWTSHHVLQTRAHEVVEQAPRAYGRDGGKGTRFPSTCSQAGTGLPPRRGVRKVAVAAQGVTTRVVVTDLAPAAATVLSRHLSCARGQADKERKDPPRSLQSARPSCHRFAANPCRLLLHAAASGLLDTRRREVGKGTPWARATMETIPLRVLQLGARVQA